MECSVATDMKKCHEIASHIHRDRIVKIHDSERNSSTNVSKMHCIIPGMVPCCAGGGRPVVARSAVRHPRSQPSTRVARHRVDRHLGLWGSGPGLKSKEKKWANKSMTSNNVLPALQPT